MPLPTPIVEIAFDDSPYAVSPTWTAVTSYVRSMTVDRGRSDDWGDFSGSASVVLDNRDRRFDPFNTSGIYYGKLLPRRQIRIRAQTVELGVTTTHDVFRGYISGWSPEWTDGGKDSTVTLSCFDAMQFLASEQLPAEWAEDYILSLNPRHYWKLDEPISSFNASTVAFKDNGSSPIDLIGKANIIEAGPELAPGLPSKSVQGLGTIAETGLGTVGTVINVTASMWFMPTGEFNFPSASFVTGGRTLNIFYGIYNQAPFNTDYTLIVVEYYVSSVVYQWRSTISLSINEPHHIAFAVDSSTGNGTLYIDGINRTGTRTSGSTAPITQLEYYAISDAAFQQVCLFPSILTQTQIQTIIQHSQAQIPETTTARFNRIISKSPFSPLLTSAPASPSNSVLDITNDVPHVTPELQKVADSEGGALFVSKNGTLTMFSQNQIRTQSSSIVSQVTYGDGGTDIGLDVQLSPDGDSMRNVVNVTMSQGGVYSKENSTSVNAYGTASMSIDTQVSSLSNADQLANIATGWGGQVYPRLSPIDVVLSRDNLWSPTMALELMDRITVNVKPPTGNTVSVPMLVQRISHSVVAGRWQTTLEGSARWAAVFIIGQSLLGGTDLLR